MKIRNNILLLTFLLSFQTCFAQTRQVRPSSGASISFQNNLNKSKSSLPQIRPNNIQIKMVRREVLGSYVSSQSVMNHCGFIVTYPVVVTTYCDHYSNGTWRTWQTITRR